MSRESRRLKKQLNQARKQAERDARRAADEAAKREAAYQKQANDLLSQMRIMKADHGKQLNSLKLGFENTISGIVKESDKRYGNLQTQSDKRISDLSSLMLQQRNDFASRFDAQQQQFTAASNAQVKAFDTLNAKYGDMANAYKDSQNQYAAMSNAYQESQAAYLKQQQLAANAANAYVPAPVASADTPLMGDQRTEVGGRKQSDNTLSSLTILSGLGTTGNPTAGLQLA